MSSKLDFERTYDDPIIDEIHENRRVILSRFGNDIDAYMTFVANRRIPGARYVDARGGARPESDHLPFTYPPVGTPGILCACEKTAEYDAKP